MSAPDHLLLDGSLRSLPHEINIHVQKVFLSGKEPARCLKTGRVPRNCAPCHTVKKVS